MDVDAKDWIDRTPHRGPASEWLADAARRYITLDATELHALASHWSDVEEEAHSAHIETGRTPNELYADGMPSPEWEIWEAYRVSRTLAGLCHTLLLMEKIGARQALDLTAVLESEAVRRRARIALRVIDNLPEHKRTLGTVYEEVATEDNVKPDSVRRSINRVVNGSNYKKVSYLRDLCIIICKLGNLLGDTFAHSLPTQLTDKMVLVHDVSFRQSK